MITKIQAGEIYEHYKGKQYKVISVSCCTESLQLAVVYQCLYDNNVSQIWHRPLDMFLGNLVVDDKEVQRFKRVDE